MLAQDQAPPKAVNIIRPSSPLLYYLKQRPSSTLNYPYQHSHQNHPYSQQRATTPKTLSDSHSDISSMALSDSDSSSPSTLSTFSGGPGTTGSPNRLTTPSILNSTPSFGFGFFQAQQNSTATTATSPATWLKSGTSPTSQQRHNPNATVPPPTPTPINSFMHPFSSRFFCGTSQPTDDSSYFSRKQRSDLEGQSSADRSNDNDFDSIDGDSDMEQTTTESVGSYEDSDTDTDSYSISDDDSMMDSGNESQLGDDDEYDDDMPIKVVARIKNGIIMNGKGEMVNKGFDDSASHTSWLDEARVGRKIADLEIEKTSLLTLNSALECKVAQQATKIAQLEKQLQLHELPLSPISDKDLDDEDQPCFDKQLLSPEHLIEEDIANDQVYQRLRSMLLGLIEQAEEAVLLQTKSTGRVLTRYHGDPLETPSKKDTITLDAPPTTLKHSTRTTPASKHGSHRRSLQTTTPRPPQRRASDSQQRLTPSVATTRKRTAIERSLSRLSSPAVMVSTNSDVSPVSRSASPTPSMRRSSTNLRQSQLRKSQDLASPKWHY